MQHSFKFQQFDKYFIAPRLDITQLDDNFNSCAFQVCDRQRPGGRLDKKDGLTRYGNSHVKDKTS